MPLRHAPRATGPTSTRQSASASLAQVKAQIACLVLEYTCCNDPLTDTLRVFSRPSSAGLVWAVHRMLELPDVYRSGFHNRLRVRTGSLQRLQWVYHVS
jgi:hypothetical protein